MGADPSEPSLKRLRAAIDMLEAAVERRLLQDARRADADEEFAIMQDDRARLAVELDGALHRSRALESANGAAAERIARAGAAIEAWLHSADAAED